MHRTQRQIKTAAAYAFAGRGRVIQRDIAKQFGISQSAVSHRLRRFKASLSEEQQNRYLQAATRGRRTRIVAMQLNFSDNV